MKKVLCLILAAVMLMGLAACGKTEKPAGTGSGEARYGTGDYASIDVSEPVELRMIVLVGAVIEDDMINRVFDIINQKLSETINATIKLEQISFVDEDRFRMLYSTGEECDLIYTCPEFSYKENASNGAFTALSEDFLKTYMPKTWADTPSVAWRQASVGGTIYAVPRSYSTYSMFGDVYYRKDLADKYNLQVNDFDSFENFVKTIAAEEPGVFGFRAQNAHLNQLWYNHKDDLVPLDESYYFVWKYSDNFDPQDIFYYYTSDYFKEYALRMADWAAAGVWPADALGEVNRNGSEFVRAGTAAASCDSYLNATNEHILEFNNKYGYDLEALDLFPDCATFVSSYAGDMMAIPASSKHPERAAMALDMIKNDPELNRIITGGIEGEQYTYDKDTNTVVLLQDGQAAYAWDSFAWALRSSVTPSNEVVDESVQKVKAAFDKREISNTCPALGFPFEASVNSDIETKMSTIASIELEYQNAFAYGVYGDETEQKVEEFQQKLIDAGVNDVLAEFQRQVAEWIR